MLRIDHAAMHSKLEFHDIDASEIIHRGTEKPAD